jgi:DNA gyrase subunit B
MIYSSLPPKLADCRLHGLDSQAELFIVEGDSAARSIERLRDLEFQAVLPMQGKPLNAIKAKESVVRKNPLLGAVINALGVDLLEATSLSRARYSRVLLLCDPDADGIHCATLLLFFFYRWFPAWIVAERLWMVRPPLMQMIAPGIDGGNLAYSEEEGNELALQLKAESNQPILKQRFRGLASIPEKILKQSCLEPISRRVELMTCQEAQACVEMMYGKT